MRVYVGWGGGASHFRLIELSPSEWLIREEHNIATQLRLRMQYSGLTTLQAYPKLQKGLVVRDTREDQEAQLYAIPHNGHQRVSDPHPPAVQEVSGR